MEQKQTGSQSRRGHGVCVWRSTVSLMTGRGVTATFRAARQTDDEPSTDRGAAAERSLLQSFSSRGDVCFSLRLQTDRACVRGC